MNLRPFLALLGLAQWAFATVPVANNDHIVAYPGETTPYLKFDFTDPDADGASSRGFSVVSPPQHGTVTLLNPANSPYFTYTPAAGYVGPDRFTWKASEAGKYSGTATVRIQVRAPTSRAGAAVLVFANEALYPVLKTEIDRLAADLRLEGYASEVVAWPASSTVAQVHARLQTEYRRTDRSLSGAILIGSLPKPKTGNYNDLVYWRMDALQTSGKVITTDIWVSRIIADDTAQGSEATLIRRALDANHACRTGQSRLPHAAYVYDAFDGFQYSTAAACWSGMFGTVLALSEPTDNSVSKEFLNRSDINEGGADALVAGGEIFDENSHGNAGSYINGAFNEKDLYRLIAQQRVILTGSCISGAFGGIASQHIFTRGGGALWTAGATAISATGALSLTYSGTQVTRLRAAVARGESWGHALRTDCPWTAFAGDMLAVYGDLSLGIKPAPANAMPVITALSTGSAVVNQPTTITVAFSDPDGSGAANAQRPWRHQVEWFLAGYDSGKATPTRVTDSRTSGYTTITHTWTTTGDKAIRVEVIDAWGARVWKEVTIAVGTGAGAPNPSPAPAQGPYAGVIPIPGTVQTERYDLGGEGVAYHDTSKANEASTTYRTTEKVDAFSSGIGWTANGEWLEYTVKVASPGAYAVSARVAVNGKNAALSLTMDGTTVLGKTVLPNTYSWTEYSDVALGTVILDAGQQILRLKIDKKGFGIDSLTFTAISLPPGNG